MQKVIPLEPGNQGKAVNNLHEALQFLIKNKVLQLNEQFKRYSEELETEIESSLFGKATAQLVYLFKEQHDLLQRGRRIDQSVADKINELLEEFGGLSNVENNHPWVVRGHVISHELRGLSGQRVLVVDKNVGKDVTLSEGLSGERGAYEIRYSLMQRGKEKPDIQVQVIDANGDTLAVSAVRYNAGSIESGLDIVIPEEKLSQLAEYSRLTHELGAQLGNSGEMALNQRLADLKEDEQQQDITYLANKTGWDARMVAMTSLANQFAERSGIEPEFYYALFRAGVPANEAVVNQMAPDIVKQTWERAIVHQILPAELKENIPETLEKFRKYGAGRILKEPAQVGISSFRELIENTLDESKRSRFASLYYDKKANLESFWDAVRENFPEEVDRLQLDGKLGFLTINNALLVQRLHTAQRNGLQTPLDLVRKGFYRKKAWKDLLEEDVPIPNEIPGEKREEKKANYASFMASQLRLSYPTAVVADMVRTNAIPLGVEPLVKKAVTHFLDAQQGKFELGIHPIEYYLRENNLKLEDPALAQVKKLQRVYQISPSDEAMGKLLEHGLDSARAIMRYDEQTFVRTFKEEIGGEPVAMLIYAKAHQVHHAVLNIATSFLLEKSMLPIYAMSNLPALNNVEVSNDTAETGVITYPTLEGIFGEMDYCACEHCRSWLSPAAYLVDLLQFLDPPVNEEGNPLDVLLDRRPDIQHLQLTCENTNTVLPYIDLVNEVLEHYVVNNSLDTYTGHDIEEGVTTEELLANPQFVNDAAYTELRKPKQVFPPPLPFHQPLETLRRYFDNFELPLHEVMERLRRNDDLERSGNVADSAYGWRDILIERLQLSRSEYAVLTDSSMSLQELYGEDPRGVTIDELINHLQFTEEPDLHVGTTRKNWFGIGNAKLFSRKFGLSYEELIAILRSKFINSCSRLIPKLEKLGLSFTNIKKLKGQLSAKKLRKLVPFNELDFSQYGGKDQQSEEEKVKQLIRWVDESYDEIMGLIRFVDPSGSEDVCSFDTVEFRYALPDFDKNTLRPVEFLKLLRFIRLWRKLGWSIEQTDKVMAALYPADQCPAPADDYESAREKLDKGFQTLLLRLAHLQTVMEQLRLSPKHDLNALLACWATIDTHGYRSLYRQMFLNPTILALDGVFQEDGYGSYLAQKREYQQPGAESPKLSDHAEALRAAFNLTQEEFDLICQDLGFDDDAVLNLANVSVVFRYGYLSRKLHLSVQEFLALKRMSGINPFQSLDIAQPLNPDQPLGEVRPPAIRFIELAKKIKDSPFKISQLLYFLQHIDLSGKASPSKKDILAFAQMLLNDLLRIDREHVIQDDPTGEIARAKMALVYGSEATDVFFGLLNSTSRFSMDYSHGQSTLENNILDVTNRIIYDDFQKKLFFKGAMTATEKAALEAPSTTNEFQAAVQGLFDAGQKFFNRYPELLSLHDAYLFFGQLQTSVKYTHNNKTLNKSILVASSGRLSYDDFDKQLHFNGVMDTETADDLKKVDVRTQFQTAVDNLHTSNQANINNFFTRYPDLKEHRPAYLQANDSEEQQRSVLLTSFLPTLCELHKRQQVRQTVSAQVGADLVLVTLLLEDASLLHAASIADDPSIVDFLALETQGLSADIYFADDVAGDASQPNIDMPTIDYREGRAKLPYNPTGDNVSGVWHGFLEAPDNGSYKFYVQADAGADIRLELDGEEEKLELKNGIWKNKDRIKLEAGRLYELALTALKVKDKLVLEWERQGMGRQVMPAQQLYPATSLKRFESSYLRVLKALAITDALALSSEELAHFATRVEYQIAGEGWLNALPTKLSSAGATTKKLLRGVLALLQYCALKDTFKVRDERLLEVLRDPEAMDEDGNHLLSRVTGWQEDDLPALLEHFKMEAGDLFHLEHFGRVHDAFAIVRKMGIGAATLVTNITNEPTSDAIRTLQAALRARYDQSAWLKVVQPINDELRSLQRDALVAFVLHKLKQNKVTEHINTPDKLFEYFLIDVQMDSCMKTSRIKQAISSVQLFVQRCVINLEPQVASLSIKTGQWEWMKRYRVWEANRKVFLWPENWLEPELRDNKSPFFKDLESELLQSDITDDAAATALVHYLEKLDEVAKLEICGMYYEENTLNNKADDVTHVIARTAGARRTYYYRRQEGDISWTPWEKIDLNIEDNPVLPVVWKGRLFLFWVSVLQEAFEPTPSDEEKPIDITKISRKELKGVAGEAKMQVGVMLNWSEYYHGKWQPARTSDVNKPLCIDKFPVSGDGKFDRNRLVLGSSEYQEKTKELCVHVLYHSKYVDYYKLYSTHSLPISALGYPSSCSVYSLDVQGRGRSFEANPDTFEIEYTGYLTGIGNNAQWSDDPNYLVQNNSDPTGGFKKILLNPYLSTYDIIEPRHRVTDIFEAPFFFQDPRHVFFVKSEVSKISVGGYLDVGIQPHQYNAVIDPPELLVKPDFPRPSQGFFLPYELITSGVVDSSLLTSFLKHDSQIRQAIGATGAIQFGNRLVRPNGSEAIENWRNKS